MCLCVWGVWGVLTSSTSSSFLPLSCCSQVLVAFHTATHQLDDATPSCPCWPAKGKPFGTDRKVATPSSGAGPLLSSLSCSLSALLQWRLHLLTTMGPDMLPVLGQEEARNSTPGHGETQGVSWQVDCPGTAAKASVIRLCQSRAL